LPVREDYWSEASGKRGISLTLDEATGAVTAQPLELATPARPAELPEPLRIESLIFSPNFTKNGVAELLRKTRVAESLGTIRSLWNS